MKNETIPLAGGRSKPGPSRMAGGIALLRYGESKLPEDVRIFCDPYAVHFVDPAIISWAKEHPAEAQAMVRRVEETMPGWNNAILARIRYFDEVVQNAPAEGFTQLLLPGAGYDTRALRIPGLDSRIRVFEVDRPETLLHKRTVLEKVLPALPENVTSVPCDMAEEDCWPALEEAGFSRTAKTLVLLEGLVMYLPRPAVEALLAGIAGNTGAGSTVLFDFVPRSLADGSSDAEGGQNIRDWTARTGEPIVSGFAEGEVVPFLNGLGYSSVQVMPARVFGQVCYTGKNAGRKVSGLLAFAYATISGAGTG